MLDAVKQALVRGLTSEKDECRGWNAIAAAHEAELINGLSVLSYRLIRLTLPPLVAYNVRVPETIRLTVPGSAVNTLWSVAWRRLDASIFFSLLTAMFWSTSWRACPSGPRDMISPSPTEATPETNPPAEPKKSSCSNAAAGSLSHEAFFIEPLPRWCWSQPLCQVKQTRGTRPLHSTCS